MGSETLGYGCGSRRVYLREELWIAAAEDSMAIHNIVYARRDFRPFHFRSLSFLSAFLRAPLSALRFCSWESKFGVSD